MALEIDSKARIQTRTAASLSQADPSSWAQPVSLTWGPMPRPHHPTATQATGIRDVLSHRREYKESGALPKKGPRTESLKQWGAGPGMRPGHTEEGVRLRESRPLPQRLPHLPHPARPPVAPWERSSIPSSRPRFLFLPGTCRS